MILRDMTANDIDAVLRIERQVHAHPWTRGNFSDALAVGYLCKVAMLDGGMLGYAVLMRGVDDAELLDIGIAARHQRQGWGRKLLEAMLALAREPGKQRAVLEVRAGNVAARNFYRNAGFVEIGLRKDYYRAQNACEDAILMGREL
ncbi:MAG: ribosomal-protein-alanine N-acetyltransferase [Gallionellaceae bacterium]|nr:MAG: ribosomal-protein-alanine N-acetyltransferase [Gallionellaceae bacterium]